jgi:chitobiase/beta-hexosaminidase-like protein
MLPLQWPVSGRYLHPIQWPIIVAAGVVALLTTTSVALAFWTVRGSGMAVARTERFDLTGARPALRVVGHDILVSWEQNRLSGGRLGNHNTGGYRVHRYDASGHPQEVDTGCSGRIAGSNATLGCVEHNVPEGIWQYAVRPVLGSWTGTQGPRSEIRVGEAVPTMTSPAIGSATRDRRPILAGTASSWPDELPRVTVVLSDDRFTRRAARSLAATVVNGSWWVRPQEDIPEGAYVVRVGQADYAGHVAWSQPTTFIVDTTAPSTADNSRVIGNGWKGTNQTVILTPWDPSGSGIAATYFTTDGSTPTTNSRQSTSVTLGEGNHSLKYFSVDRAGNAEVIQSASTRIRIDTTAPRVASLGPLPDIISRGQRLTASGVDSLSGVARIVYEYRIHATEPQWRQIGSSTIIPDYALTWSHLPADGTYELRARAFDAAGNDKASAARIVQVDD